MLDDETTVDPRLPVSDAEYEAALTAARPQLPGEVEGNRASGVEMALIAAHAVLVPRIERALEAMRETGPCWRHHPAHAPDQDCGEYATMFADDCDACWANMRAAFWTAHSKEEPR